VHWDDSEEGVLRAVADQIALSFEDLRRVEAKKAWGFKFALIFVIGAAVLASDVIFLTIATGGIY
jgi:GAF domain-containing protein